LAWRERDASGIEQVRTRQAARRGGRVAVGVQRTGLAGAAAVGGLEGAGHAVGAGAAVGPAEARVAEAVFLAAALGEGEGVIGTDVARLRVLFVVGRSLLVRPARADQACVRAVVKEAGGAEAGQRRDRGLRRDRVGVAELAGSLPLAGLEGVRRARAARRRGEVQLSLRVPRDALAADSALGGVGGAELRGHEAGRARRRAELRRERVARAGPAGLVRRGVLEAARVAHAAHTLRRVEAEGVCLRVEAGVAETVLDAGAARQRRRVRVAGAADCRCHIGILVDSAVLARIGDGLRLEGAGGARHARPAVGAGVRGSAHGREL
jgi:hypothetical protein